MKLSTMPHEFVDQTPRDLEEGKLYVSIRYRTAVHLCACGCGSKIVTPLRPAKWKLYFDGESVSLSPSVGSWQLPCRSHYWIEKDNIRWAKPWTDKQIAEGRMNDAKDVHAYYESRKGGAVDAKSESSASGQKVGVLKRSWRRVRHH